MLGNFSFGQYFKEGAIAFATEFIRDRLGLDWDRIWVSVHAGDPGAEARARTRTRSTSGRQIGMPPERIVPLPSSENFWSVGGPGPCGPDSEIYYDWGVETGCAEGCLPGCCALRALPRVLEPRLHVVRAPPGPDADRRCRSRTSTRAWASSARRGSSRTSPSVYDTDGYQQIMSWIADDLGRRVRRFGRRDQGAPRARRPRPRDDLPRRRGDHALERRARLRPAPHRPAGGPARPADRNAGAVRRRACRRR